MNDCTPRLSTREAVDRIRNRLAGFPRLETVFAALLDHWPEHDRYLWGRLDSEDAGTLARQEDVAALVLKITGGELPTYCRDYRWMCDRFAEEQLFFFREGRYRLSTFAEADRQIYSDREYMGRYVRGILASQIFWGNHARALDIFRTRFLAGNRDGYHHLEVGPGHGLFLYFAAMDPRCAAATGWDVSAASLAATEATLARLDVDRMPALRQADVTRAEHRQAAFDSIVISEVLEHLERPGPVLSGLRDSLRPGGRIFINVPINSPAPDHIYLLRSIDEARSLVRDAGLIIDEEHFLPVGGVTLERAIRRGFDISCVLFGRRAAS